MGAVLINTCIERLQEEVGHLQAELWRPGRLTAAERMELAPYFRLLRGTVSIALTTARRLQRERPAGPMVEASRHHCECDCEHCEASNSGYFADAAPKMPRVGRRRRRVAR